MFELTDNVVILPLKILIGLLHMRKAVFVKRANCRLNRLSLSLLPTRSLVPSPLPAAILQWPERWSGTFAQYFDTTLRALANILASASISVICNLAASFAHLRESYLGILSNEINLYPILPLSQFRTVAWYSFSMSVTAP